MPSKSHVAVEERASLKKLVQNTEDLILSGNVSTKEFLVDPSVCLVSGGKEAHSG
jgi:hypothetical protein